MQKLVLLGLVALILCAASTAGCTSNVQTEATQPKTVTIGALVPLTGSSASIGANVNSTIHVAEADINNYLASTNASFRVQLIVKDTGMTPQKTLAAMQALHEEGVIAVVGPFTSTDLIAITPYANENGMVLISYGSTAPSLGIERANVFRLLPNDSNQGPALASAMREQGVKLLVPFVYDDVYGNGIFNTTRASFEQQGGVVTEGIRFPVNTTNFTSVLDVAQPQLTRATATYGPSSVGVLFIGFENNTLPMLVRAGDDPQWSQVHWWGVEATPINTILSNTTVATSAVRLNYTIQEQFGGQGEQYDHLMRNASVQNTVQTPYGSFAYDAVWIMARAIAETNAGNSTQLQAAIPNAASSYTGVTGNTALNAVGDRAYANYDFWTIRSQNGTFVKVKTAQFRTDPRSGTSVVLGPSTAAAVVH